MNCEQANIFDGDLASDSLWCCLSKFKHDMSTFKLNIFSLLEVTDLFLNMFDSVPKLSLSESI